MRQLNSLAQWILRQPIIWGGLAWLGFYALIQHGYLKHELVARYFSSHPVERITAFLFFVALAALVIKVIDLATQFGSLGDADLPDIPAGGQSVSAAPSLIGSLGSLPAYQSNTYLVRRLRDALEFVRRKGSADDLDVQMRHLSDLDLERMNASYSFTRIIIWAIPILGFLGTVIGITLAIANLSPEALEKSLPEVTSGLGVAFDTTALALALSIVLMFSKFFVEQFESHLLSVVDDRADAPLVGRFHEYGSANDPHLASLHRMIESVLEATDSLVNRQVKLWRGTVDEAQQQWTQLTESCGSQIQSSLAGALSDSLEQHAAALATAEASIAERNRRHWNQVQESLLASAEGMAQQQAELVRQGQVLREVVDATGQVKELESVLNRNLASLAGSHNFEETVISLSAAIQLLTARLSHETTDRVRIDLTSSSTPESTSSAA